jgi:argininosuccinate synthase
MKKKVVLAFSGGLDTSFCCIYLAQDRDLEVHSVIVNTGGFSEAELQEIERRAYALGVASHAVVDETTNYYDGCIKYLIYGNVLKNATYPLSVSAERVSQATAIANYVKKIGADYVAHGSTGAGNDQVRFDMIFNIIIPGVEIITPIRDLKLSREAEIKYLQEHGVEYSAEKARYSINKGLWGTSVGGQETLTSHETLPESAWPTQVTETESRKIEADFYQR